jgi:arylsulfatase I/J
MKFTDFEGGTRVAAWVSGGALPTAVRGTTHTKGLMHIADWYATLSELAGVDPTDAKAATFPGIPPIDSVSAGQRVLLTSAASARELPSQHTRTANHASWGVAGCN